MLVSNSVIPILSTKAMLLFLRHLTFVDSSHMVSARCQLVVMKVSDTCQEGVRKV